jgi:hypothetical protein
VGGGAWLVARLWQALAWPAKVVPFWHGEEGKGDVVVDSFICIGRESIDCMETCLYLFEVAVLLLFLPGFLLCTCFVLFFLSFLEVGLLATSGASWLLEGSFLLVGKAFLGGCLGFVFFGGALVARPSFGVFWGLAGDAGAADYCFQFCEGGMNTFALLAILLEITSSILVSSIDFSAARLFLFPRIFGLFQASRRQ